MHIPAQQTIIEPIRGLLFDILFHPRRLLLSTPGVEATVPMLRGVWGAALHDLDLAVYRQVFEPAEPQVPGYLLRPAPPDPATAPALDWFLFGDAIRHDAVLRRAWDIASGRGLGPERRPFVVRQFVELGPDGLATATGPWTLDRASWPAPADAPCRLRFAAPLRLRRHGRLIESPTLADLTAAAWRRVAALLPEQRQADWRALQGPLLEHARQRPATWHGERLDLHRWSARQQAELDLHGISGVLDLPEGPGELAPLLAAASWLHLGKGTVFGLGQMEVQPWPA
jgi:hypothetical protein